MMTRNDLDSFEKLRTQLNGVYDELALLSKKSPTDAVNKFKLGFINALFRDANALLGKVHRPFPDFELFNVDDVPSNSDVVFILAQYIRCLEKMRSDNVVWNNGGWCLPIKAPKEKGADADGVIFVRSSPPSTAKSR